MSVTASKTYKRFGQKQEKATVVTSLAFRPGTLKMDVIYLENKQQTT